MEVFVANPTRQHRQFDYRMLEQEKIRRVSIPAGSQAFLPDRDLEGASLEHVLKQLRRAGGVPASEPHSIVSTFTLLYSVAAKPITSNQIDAAAERDLAVRQEIAGDKTEEAGLVNFNVIEKTAGPRLQKATLEVTQVVAQSDGNAPEVPQTGGVDTEVEVNRSAGAARRSFRDGTPQPQRGRRRG